MDVLFFAVVVTLAAAHLAALAVWVWLAVRLACRPAAGPDDFDDDPPADDYL